MNYVQDNLNELETVLDQLENLEDSFGNYSQISINIKEFLNKMRNDIPAYKKMNQT